MKNRDKFKFTSAVARDVVTWVPKILFTAARIEEVDTLPGIITILHDKDHLRHYSATYGRYPLTSTVGDGHQKTFLCQEHTPELMRAKQRFADIVAECTTKEDIARPYLRIIKNFMDRGEHFVGHTHLGLINTIVELWVAVFYTSERITKGPLLESFPRMRFVAVASNDLRGAAGDPVKMIKAALKMRAHHQAYTEEIQQLLSSMTDGLFSLLDDTVLAQIDLLDYTKEFVPINAILYAMFEGYHEQYYSKNKVVCDDYGKEEAEVFQDLYAAFRAMNPAGFSRIGRREGSTHRVIRTNLGKLAQDIESGDYSESDLYDDEATLPKKFEYTMDHTLRGCPFGLGRYRCPGEVFGLHLLMWLDQECQSLSSHEPEKSNE